MPEPVMTGLKTCGGECGLEKTVLDFHVNRSKPDGRAYSCKVCVCKIRKADRDAHPAKFRQRNRDYRDSNPEQVKRYFKDRNLQREHGITLEQFEALFAAQGGRCAICRCVPRGKGIHLDHDHITGKIRGILCVRCNAGLGMFGDSPENMQRACEYLTQPAITPEQFAEMVGKIKASIVDVINETVGREM